MDKRPIDPLTARFDDLHKDIELLTDEVGASEGAELLSDLLYGWLCHSVDTEQERTIDPNKRYEIREAHLTKVWRTLALMTNLAKVHETWNSIEYLKQQQKP